MKSSIIIILGVIILCITVLGIKFYNTKNFNEEERMTLIPRKTLFGNPEKSKVYISPNGQYISYLSPLKGVLNIYVAPIGQPNEEVALTCDRNRGIRNYFWAYDNKHILYVKDNEGDENWQVHKVNVETLEDTILTPQKGIRAQINNVSHLQPNHIVIGLNTRDPSYHDLYKLNLETKELTLLFENKEYAAVITDDNYNVRLLYKQTDEGGSLIYDAETKKELIRVGAEDVNTTGVLSLDLENDLIYLMDTRNSDKAALYKYNIKTKEQELIYQDDKSDIESAMIHPTKNYVQAVSTNYTKQEWHFLDKEMDKDVEFITKELYNQDDAEIQIISRTLDDNIWVVNYSSDKIVPKYYLFNRSDKNLQYLYSYSQELEKYKLAKMHSIVIPARDGLELVSYLTLPTNVQDNSGNYIPTETVPLILLVHGGPTARDSWGLHPEHQWLANRGYAVLSVNYRGSLGFGKKFVNAGNREWAAKMHDDLIDAVNWAIENKVTDPDKVAIMGGSYGGYATLVGLTMTPDVFACGVDIVGPSNLITLAETIPPYWKPMWNTLRNKLGGDPTTEEGRKILAEKSPINYVDNIKKPLLIAQGANDPRVKQAESDQIVGAMKEKNIPVTYILYPDEGHGFQRPENKFSYRAVAEKFLHKNLKGRYEEPSDDFKGSSIKFVEGESFIFPEEE